MDGVEDADTEQETPRDLVIFRMKIRLPRDE